jgi:hypothetical protein
MYEFEKLKKIIGLLMCGFALFGAIIALCFHFDLFTGNNGKFFAHGDIFDWVEGGASNGPIFYGLIAVAGAILLSSVKHK